MLITFHSKASHDIIMFGNVAISLIKLMGHSGTVPSAILANDIPAALVKLNNKLGVTTSEDNKETPVRADLAIRAWPLIKLLHAAVEQKCEVMWD